MASPTALPPVQQRPPRSMAGPVVLIAIGIVLLLSTLRVLQWHALMLWFGRFWPLLLILWGLIKLAEYYQAQRSGTRSPGIGVGGVFLVIFLVLFGITVTGVSRFNWGAIRDEINIDNNDFPFFGHNYMYEDEVAQDFPAGATLRIETARGAVNVNSADDQRLRVVVHKRINAENQEDANKWNEGTKPKVTVSGNVVVLNSNTEGAGDHWVASDLDIFVPRKTPVIVSSRRGDVSILGRDGDVEISSQRGEVSVTDVNGKASLGLSRSSARISQIAGDVLIDGRGPVNDVSLDDVKGAVRLNGEFMEGVRLAKIAKRVTFKSSRTDLEVAKLDGDLNLDSGDLRAANLTGPVRLLTRSKDIRLDGVSGDIRLENKNGSVELRISKLGSMQLQNHSADIQVYLPDKAGFQFSARARNGDVESDFGEIKTDTRGEETTATGTVGSGGPNVVINNEHGSIQIRRASLALAVPPAAPKPPAPPSSPHEPVEPSEN